MRDGHLRRPSVHGVVGGRQVVAGVDCLLLPDQRDFGECFACDVLRCPWAFVID